MRKKTTNLLATGDYVANQGMLLSNAITRDALAASSALYALFYCLKFHSFAVSLGGRLWSTSPHQ
jgi:hypothetical protein